MSGKALDVLLLGAGYGAGHNQAALAVDEALREMAPGCRTRFLDYLDFFPRLLASATVAGYALATKYVPPLYGLIFGLTGILAQTRLWDGIAHRIGLEPLRSLLASTRPRVVVCTHPLPAAVLGRMRALGEPVPPVLLVVTDMGLHAEWVAARADAICVAAEELADACCAWGIEPERVRVTGIPVRAAFRCAPSRMEARQRLGWPSDATCLLFVASAGGMMGGVPEACAALLRLPERVHLTVVCGRDRHLEEELRRWAAGPFAGRLHVVGFCDQMAVLMAAADVVITKAGGLTTSEVLALGRPCILYRIVPGQEAQNAAFLARHGAALVANRPGELAACVRRLLPLEERMRWAKAAAELGRPAAALAVAEEALRLAEFHPGPRSETRLRTCF